MRSGNPALNEKIFKKDKAMGGDAMTIQGTANKTMFLLLLLLIPAAYVWMQFFEIKDPQAAMTYVMPIWIGGAIVGFILALITIFKAKWSPYTAPLYALAEGAFLGGLSAYMESMFPEIVLQAVGLTFGTFIALLLAYKSRLIKATKNFRLGIVAATGGICLVYMASFLLGLGGIRMPYIHESGLIGIGFSAFVVVIAALNLVLDFDFIEQGAEKGAPKYLEWYGAFGLLVTLVWLYIEILRLLSKLRSR